MISASNNVTQHSRQCKAPTGNNVDIVDEVDMVLLYQLTS